MTVPVYSPKIMNQLTFTPLPSYGFAFCQIGCYLPLKLQVLPDRPQLQTEARDIKISPTWSHNLSINTICIQEVKQQIVIQSYLSIKNWLFLKIFISKTSQVSCLIHTFLLYQGELVNVSLPPLIQIIYGPAQDLQKGKYETITPTIHFSHLY